MELARELSILKHGTSEKILPRGFVPQHFIAYCYDDASLTLKKSKDLLSTVIEHATHESVDTMKKWEVEKKWRQFLPNQFIKYLTTEAHEFEENEDYKQNQPNDRWDLASWVYWFESTNRTWYWEEDNLVSSNTFEFTLVSNDLMITSPLEVILKFYGAFFIDSFL